MIAFSDGGAPTPQAWCGRKNALVALSFLAVVAVCTLSIYVWKDIFFIMEFHVKGSLRRPFDIEPLSLVVPSSRICNRIELPAQFSNDSQSPYNPAALRDPNTGEWIAMFRIEEVWFGISNYTKFGTYLEGRMRSHPLLVTLGNATIPSTAAPRDARILEMDSSYQELAEAEGSQIYKAADWRPFVWRNEVYLGHWIAYMPGEERMAISRLDREEGAVKLVHRFTSLSDEVEAAVLPDLTPGQGSLRKAGVLRLTSGKLSEQGSKFRREKNWGFWEEDGKLLILYSLVPCTVILAFDPEQPSQPQIHSRNCYVQQAPSIQDATGLDILQVQTHLSGNPVPWDIHNGPLHQEYLAMLHTKDPEYINWAVRLNRQTLRVTHISAGPVLRNRDYRNKGFLKTALVVSSFHVLPKEDERGAAAATAAEAFVRIYYGEGDRYGCWLDVDVKSILWHEVEESTAATRANLRVAPF